MPIDGSHATARRLYLFDIDGTLTDSDPLHYIACAL